MVHVFVRHKVEDYVKWRSIFDAAKEFRTSNGEESFQIFRDSENLNVVTLLFRWESLDKAKGFMNSNELKEKMKEAGVSEEPEIYFFDET